MKPSRILIIDDSEEVGWMLVASLQVQGLEAESAANATDGLKLARSKTFDLILLDLGLPDADGLEVCKEIRSDPSLTHIPVIMMTGRESTDDKVRAFEWGATDYVNKPFNIPELIARIMALLRRKEAFENIVDASRKEQLKTHEELRRISSAVEYAGENIAILNRSGVTIYFNRSFGTMFDVALTDLNQPEQMRRLFANKEVWSALWQSCSGGQAWSGEVLLRSRSGRDVPTLCRANPLPPSGESGGEVVLILTDITERKRLERELLHLANHDPLTGLFNRRYFAEHLTEAIEKNRPEASDYVLYLDLDNFKVVNSSAGYEAGDRLLREIASILRVNARPEDIVARFGGDDFTLLLRGTTEAGAVARAQQLVALLDEYRFAENGRTYPATASIGVSRVDPRVTAEDTVSHAGSACYLAKERGRNGWALFRPDNELLRDLGPASGWSLAIKDAIRDRRMEIWLQPILPVRERITSVYFEVLLRMREADGRLVLPGEFMGAAQRFGNMLRIDRYVIERSIELMRAHPTLHLAINLSAQSLGDPFLPDFVEECFRNHGVDPSRASFEITETAMIENLKQATGLINRIRGHGCRFALDDFGSGFSSMTYLRDLPVDYVKIDGSFIRQLDTDPVSRSLVRALHEVAHILGKQTVAEYVTNADVFQQVVELGLDFAQGWHICEPAPPEKFLRDGITSLVIP